MGIRTKCRNDFYTRSFFYFSGHPNERNRQDDDTTLLILKMVQLINNSVDTIFMDDEKKFYWNLYNNI